MKGRGTVNVRVDLPRDDRTLMWLFANAIASEIHVDPKHGFPEGFGPFDLAKQLVETLGAYGLQVTWRAPRAASTVDVMRDTQAATRPR